MEQVFISCIDSRIEKSKSIYANYKIGPFEKNRTVTIANNLRRALLSELDGLAITAVKIQGAMHEYSALVGVRESVLDILLNIKQVVIASALKINSPYVAYLEVLGPCEVKAGHIKFPPFLKCVDPDQHIATVSNNGHLNIVFFICPGKNYWIQLTTEQLLIHCSKVFGTPGGQNPAKQFIDTPYFEKSNILPIDAVFMPVNRVNYTIETDEEIDTESTQEHIFLEVWTNGSIHPRVAIELAANSIINQFKPFQDIQSISPKYLSARISPKKLTIVEPKRNFRRHVSGVEDGVNPSSSLDFDIGNLNLSLRPYTCLKRAGINNVRDLLEHSGEELLLLKNFGQRSLEEVQTSLYQLGFFLPDKTDLEKQ